MEEHALSIGQVASRVGLNASAIRYYERVGVLPAPTRVAGQRRYGEDTIRRLEILDVAKRAGFSLDDARVLFDAQDAGNPARDQVRELAQKRMVEVEALIERAIAVRDWLSVASGCNCQTLDGCSLFEPGAPAPETVESSLELRLTHVGG